MNLSGIETFLAIVETQSLSKAAEKLFLSQSTISYRLNALENELNTKLIERDQGQHLIKLTPKGEEFINIAKRWLALQRDTNMWMNNVSPLKLKIGSVDSLNTYLLSKVYINILRNETSIELDISSHWSNTIYRLLESYVIDVGITPRLIRTSNLLSKPIFSEKLVFVSNPDYSNYSDFVHPKYLDVKKEIYLDWGASFQIWHDSWWDSPEYSELKVDTVGMILQFINRPESWAVLPESIAKAYEKSNNLKISEFIEAPPERVCYKIVHRDPLPEVIKPLKIFESYLQQFIKDNPFLTEL